MYTSCTARTELAKCLWLPLISWALLLGLDEQMFFQYISLCGKLALFDSSCHPQYKIAFHVCVAFHATQGPVFPDHEEKLCFRCLYYCRGMVIQMQDLNSIVLDFARFSQFVFILFSLRAGVHFICMLLVHLQHNNDSWL